MKKIDIFYDYEKAYINEKQKTYFSKGEYVKLEVTPKENSITYYLPIFIYDKPESLKNLSDSKKLRIVVTMYIKNAFNVISKAEYTIHLDKKEKITDWVKYTMYGRKIYFKEITYEDEK